MSYNSLSSSIETFLFLGYAKRVRFRYAASKPPLPSASWLALDPKSVSWCSYNKIDGILPSDFNQIGCYVCPTLASSLPDSLSASSEAARNHV